MFSKKDIKIVLCCVGLVCIGFLYDNACDYIMDVLNDREEEQTSELERFNHVMNTIKEDIYNACGSDPYCRDVFVDC